MKSFSKYWWLFLVIGAILGVINPHIGFMSIFNIVELMFMGILLFVSYIVRNFAQGEAENSLFVGSVRYMMIVCSYFIPIIFFIGASAMEILFFFVSLSNEMCLSPFKVLANNATVSMILLVLTIIFNIVSLIACIGRTKNIEV